MKAAILLCSYEKNDCLPNTLNGIAMQSTTFPCQTILIDDCSPEDPEPIVCEFLPYTKYIRLPERTGGRLTRAKYFEHIDDDVDILVMLSADVVMLQPNIIDELVRGVGERVFTMAQVKNHYVLPNSHNTWDFFRQQMLDMWDVIPGGTKIYSGSQRPDGRWYFFCGAIRKQDALDLGIHETGCCDAIVDKRMREGGFKPIFMDHLKAIHQTHPWVQHPCPVKAECEYSKEFACEERGV